MSLIRYALGFSFVSLLSSQVLLGQGSDKRLDDAIAEISFLKRVVAEQDRRISELEKTVAALQLGAASRAETPIPGGSLGALAQPDSTMPWKQGATWNRLKDGMSRAQVEAILGQPTSVTTIEHTNFLTLFYSGAVPGSGSVTRKVELNDDQVYLVSRPVF
jgi:hypothetical protein